MNTDKRTLTFKVGCHGAVSGCYNVTTFIKPSPLSQFTNHWLHTAGLYVAPSACVCACIARVSFFSASAADLCRVRTFKERATGSQMVTVYKCVYLWDLIASRTDCSYSCACLYITFILWKPCSFPPSLKDSSWSCEKTLQLMTLLIPSR